VIISWAAPDDGGSPITGYIITIRTSDQITFQSELTHCDLLMSTATICTVPVTVLRAAPFNLPWGSSVYAKVVAKNIYGNSLESLNGNGAIITTTPDAPINLAEDYSVRTKSTLGLTWT